MSAAPVRLLFVLNAPTTGGAERHTLDLAGALAAQGFAPTIFALRAGPLPTPADVTLRQPAGPRALPGRLADLARALRDDPPDAVVAVNDRPVAVAYAARALARLDVPLIAVLHSTLARGSREALVQRLTARVLNRVESVVLLSRRQRRYWQGLGLRPAAEALIPNGVDLARFSPAAAAEHRARARLAFGLAPSDLVLGMNAMMRPEKNHAQLVEAVARLRARGLGARALLLGHGPTRSAVAARARDLGVAEHVIFAGERADVVPALAAFDLGVLCSTAIETLSLAALETMAMGIPMVMSDLGGAAEIVDGANSRLFAPGDADGLCRAVADLGDEGARAEVGRLARATVEARFDRPAMVAGYASHFRAVAGRRRGLSR